MASVLAKVAASLSTPLEQRLLAEYGAIFVTTATPPPAVMFVDGAEVEAFQSSLPVARSFFGEHEITLQAEALEALTVAASDLARAGGSITARAADAGGRSYEDTVTLWRRNVTRGLEHWERLGRVAPERAQSIRELATAEQTTAILNLEDTEQLYFGTFFDKSILYSVAAPGASQHLSLLAFDVAEYQDETVVQVLGKRGWYRTVQNDLPHFTYLGHAEDALPNLGLKRIVRGYQDRVYCFWTPDLDRGE